MDLSSLASLGKVAGLGGIALGVVVLLVKPVIDRAAGVPAAQRAPLLRSVAAGAFGIGALGIVAWLVSGLSGGSLTVTAGPGGLSAGHDVSGNKVTIDATTTQTSSPEPGGTPVTAGQGGLAAGHDVTGNTVTIGQPHAAGTSSPVSAGPGARLP